MAAPTRARGFYTKQEFMHICRWKSHRPEVHYSPNSGHRVRSVTKRALGAASERERMKALMTLAGVRVPMASALLAVYDPERFGVIDVRAWKSLHRDGYVSRNRAGVGLSVNSWLQYLQVIRDIAVRVGTTPRLVEISLYKDHKGEAKHRRCCPKPSNRSFNTDARRRAAASRHPSCRSSVNSNVK